MGVLQPALEPSAQDRHGPVGAGPEEATETIRALLWGKAERVGAIHPGEEKAVGRPYSSLPVVNGVLESWRGTFKKGMEW